MITAILTALAPIIGPAVAGWFARDWTTKRAAKRRAEAEAKKVEAEVNQVDAQASHVNAQATHVHAQAADVIKGSALDLMLAAHDENRRLKSELAQERALASGYIRALAHQLAERPVLQAQVVVVEPDPLKAINGGH